MGSDEIVRVGVVGGGLVGQAVHLPRLSELSDRFTVAAIADPSAKVGDALARRYAPARAYRDWRALLDAEEIDALVICSPHATHAEITLAALDRGLHVLVEKPLCIDPADGRRIAERARAVGRTVQVGYMKRYSPGYAALLSQLPDAAGLKLVDVVTYDPWMAREPFVPWRDMVAGDDIPEAIVAAAAADEARQVEATVGVGDPATVHAFSYTFLACLVHDVNLVRGVLDALGLRDAPVAVSSAAWGDGDAATGTMRLANGARWHCSWTLLRALEDFRERVTLLFDDAVRELVFGVPYDATAPAVHRAVDAPGGVHRERTEHLVGDGFRAALEHFHACVVTGAATRTPPEQAVGDLELLRELFLRRDGA